MPSYTVDIFSFIAGIVFGIVIVYALASFISGGGRPYR